MSNKKESFWIPYADLMTVLMVIFLFISIAYMGLLQHQKKQQDKIFEEYKETKENLYNELKEAFKNYFARWNLELDKDLSIKFTNPEVLFPSGNSDITPKFQQILTEFFPKYLSVIMQDKYRDKIAEIRIEGHTDDVPTHETNDPYIDNIKLSQDRSRKVLHFLRDLPNYDSLSTEQEQHLQFWLTANGLSYGRTLDSEKQLTIYSKKPIDKEKSRRVEFRIITTSEILVQKVIEQMTK
jgi:outer membrane protein OmpA-like peptidoglycan-associated protein